MIKQEDVVKIGQFNKPHGIKGELSFTFTNDAFDENEHSFLICEIDGIFVPFFLEEYRFKTNTTALVKLKGVDSVEKARNFTNKDVFFAKNHMQEIASSEAVTWDYFIGFTMYDSLLGKIGEIVAIDESTINILFIVNGETNEHLIPVVEEWILSVDSENKILEVELPDGLIE